jgi:hypothetical protein
MATSGIPYPPPTENLPIFNRKVFTGVEYDGRYLKIDADTNLLMNANNITGVENLGFEDGTIQETAFTGVEPGAISLGNVLADGDNALGQDILNLGTLNFSNGTNQITAYDNTITITETDTNASFFPVFTSGSGLQLDLRTDTLTNPITINPSNGSISTTTFIGDLIGNTIILEDFNADTTLSGVIGQNIVFNETGSGVTNYYIGSFNASFVDGVVGRSGFIQLQSGSSSGNESLLLTDTIYSISNIQQLVFGFIQLGEANFSSTITPTGNIMNHFGISATPQQTGNFPTNSILWRYSSTTATIPTWEFVINDVVQYTSGLGDLTGKWCRATFDITEPTAGNYSVTTTLVNLTDGTTETTSTFPLVAEDFSNFAPQTLGIIIVVGTDNGRNKYFGVDYVQLKQKLNLIGGGDTLAFR